MLGRHGESEPKTQLKQLCADPVLDGWLRMSAAEALRQLGSDSCVPETVALLLENGDFDSMTQAVSLATRYLSTEEGASRKSLLEGVETALQNESAGVRMIAGDTLANFGDRNVIPALEKAVETEDDDIIRGMMEHSLQTLRIKTAR